MSYDNTWRIKNERGGTLLAFDGQWFNNVLGVWIEPDADDNMLNLTPDQVRELRDHLTELLGGGE